MSDINILTPHVADLIAAGEVVERPASVIKELLENSFDAGAKNITAEIKGGAMTFIRVSDDGQGMSPEDAGLCFLRHATSKLRDERGLESIGTMGFRGEALAAISAVSRIELQTRRRGSAEGTRVVLEGGDIIEMSLCGCPEGTSMTVRDLFFNTPARLKFMKSDRAEGGSCAALALRCALGRPEVSVRFIRDGQEEFFSPGDGRLASGIYSLLGRDTAKELLELSSEEDGIKITGFTGAPRFGRGNRAKQFFFVNGRCVRSAMLQAAVEQAYKNTMLTGRFPSCVICVGISPASVDVNVHPAKTEVKFREEKRVFDAVHYAVLSALEGEGKTADISLSPSTAAAAAPKKDFYQSMSAAQYREKHGAPQAAAVARQAPQRDESAFDRGTVLYRGTGALSGKTTALNDSRTPYNIQAPQKEAAAASPRQEVLPPGETNKPEKPSSIFKTPSPLRETLPDFRLVGEAMKTYIIVEQGERLILIDKHAAHERMIFDRIKAQGHEIMSQSLLEPAAMRLDGEQMELLEKNGALLTRMGFEIEPFGENSMILRAAPADTDAADAPAMIEEICERLRKNAVSPDEAVDEILHTVACKAAIKAGWKTTDTELEEIAERVLSGEIKYCPHGRPVSVTLTKKQLDKEFSRTV